MGRDVLSQGMFSDCGVLSFGTFGGGTFREGMY